MKYTNKVCDCPACEDEHELDCEECAEYYNQQSNREFKAEQLQEFDRTEARAINGGY